MFSSLWLTVFKMKTYKVVLAVHDKQLCQVKQSDIVLELIPDC